MVASEGCVPTLFLDGVQSPIFNGTIDDLVDPSDVEGIEVYAHSSSVPIQFSYGNGCGVIVVWTRRGP